MSNCALNNAGIKLEDVNINDVRFEQFVQTVEGVLEGFDNGEYTIQTVASIIFSACDKIADLFEKKNHVDCVVTSEYVLPLISEDEAYMEFEKRVRFLLDVYKREGYKNYFYRDLIITCEELEKNVKPKGYVKTLINSMKKADR